jgi:hypothetical protein
MTVDAPKVTHVRAERVRWLWPARIPLGKVTVLDGDPSLGKSTVTLDLAARISTASPLPDGSSVESPQNTIVMSAEDAIADTIRPRLEAAAADLSRVTVFRGINEEDGPRPPVLPSDLDTLRALIYEDKAQLVIIDPLMAYLSAGIDAHRDQDVRRGLHALSALAEQTGVAIVIVRHLNKAPGGNPLYRGGGSIGIIGAARAGMLVAPDPADEHRRILACTKSNLAAKPNSLVYRLVPDLNHDCARVQWEGKSDLTADALLNPPRETRRDEATEFLEELLALGPVPQTEIKHRANTNEISWASVRRAKDDLGIDAFRKGEPGKRGGGAWWWKLPGLDDQDLDAQPSISQMSTLIIDTVSADQRASDNGHEIKALKPDVARDRPVPWSFPGSRDACCVCGEMARSKDTVGRWRHPSCEAAGVS